MDLHDFHYTYADLGMWSIVEPQLGIVNACMPVMQPFLRRIAKSKACQRILPASWLHSSHDGDHHAPVVYVDGKAVKDNANANPMDKLYPLDTVHLVGKQDSVTDSGIQIDIGRAHSERSASFGVPSTGTAL
jgi:hypothetical protein